MIEIELNNITKNYGYKNVLNGLNFSVQTGEKVAIIGVNGSGKSTVLKLMAKEELPDSGNISIRKNAKVALLNQIYEKEDITVYKFLMRSFEKILKIDEELKKVEQELVSDNSLLEKYGKLQEEYYLNGGYDVEEKFSKICTGCKITENMLNQNYSELSGGEKTKVNLGAILLKEPDILLLDEPTNHLDISTVEWLEEFLKKYKGTVIIVSHDRYFLDKIVTKTILIENGKEKIYFGNYTYFLEEDERRTLAEFNIYKNQQKQIEKMKESIATLRKFGNIAKNEMFFKRAKSIEKRLEKIETVDKVCIEKKKMDLSLDVKNRSSNVVIKVENLSKYYDEKSIFYKVNLEVHYGEKVCLIGENGSGKTTLIKMIMEKDYNFDGNLLVGNKVKIGYIPQEIIFENFGESILEYFLRKYNFSETSVRNLLAKYGFRGDLVFKKIEKLSGGEKVRLLLIELMQQDINFLIFDEPTNHIDIATREVLEENMKNYKGTILFVSHDRYFINSIANRILSIENSTIKSYTGNYDNYLYSKMHKKLLN